MRKSLHLGHLFRVPVRLHWSFFLLPVWAVYSGMRNGMTYTSILWFLLYILALFACVVLHEFGHILMARRYGVDTRDVLLTPIGGMARLNRMPEKPANEMAVSIAGPLVNILIVLVLSPTLLHAPFGELFGEEDINALFGGPKYFVRILMLANLLMVGFNLIPAFPLDGGRILRAGLSWKLGRRRGTRIAAWIGKLLALTFIAIGYYLDSMSLMFIGVFVFVMAGQEYAAVAKEAVLTDTTTGELMHRLPVPRLFETGTPMRTLFEALNGGEARDFVIRDAADGPAGIVTGGAIERALRQHELESACEGFMEPLPAVLTPDMSLDHASRLLRYYRLQTLPVVRDGRIVHCVTADQIQAHVEAGMRLWNPFSRWSSSRRRRQGETGRGR